MRRFSTTIRVRWLSVGVLFALLISCAAPRPNIVIPIQQPPAPKIMHQPQVALVLGGGGARGMAHVGVLKVLEEEHIPVSMIVGTSAGSIVGAFYASNPNADAISKILMPAQVWDIMDLSPSWTGATSGDALQNFILQHIPQRNFQQLKIPFIAVATDLKTGDIISLSSGPIAPAVNASAALSPVFQPVNLYGHTLIDGGFADLIPVDVAKRYHPKVIIAVNITPDLPRDMPTNVVSIYDRGYMISSEKFAEYNMQGASIMLHPYVGQAGLFDSSDKQQLINAGERAARNALPRICAALAENHIPSGCPPVENTH